MWNKAASFILRFRLPLLIFTLVVTAVMGYYATKIKLTYDFNKVIPDSDEEYQKYLHFKQNFGEDGNTLLIGLTSEQIYKKDFINAAIDFNKSIESTDGVSKVLSFITLQALEKNDSTGQFELKPVITGKISSQEEADSLWKVIRKQKFYEKLLFNPQTNLIVFAVTVNKDKIVTKDREAFVAHLVSQVEKFEAEQKIDAKMSGLPYVRTVFAQKIRKETQMFTLLSFAICAVVMLLFFRSFTSLIYSLLVVAIGLVWSLGFVGIMGYKINAVLGVIPPLIVIIGITNCIFLLYKYHFDYRGHGNKVKALVHVIAKIGKAAFLTNITTAIGFGVFYFTSSPMLKEFGISAFVSIFSTFIISMITVPVLFSYLSPPTPKQTKHLENRAMARITEIIFNAVNGYRKTIYVVSAILVVVAIIGTYKVRPLSYILDDLPNDDKIMVDLKFFEKQLGGIMPYEIVIESKEPGGMRSLTSFQKIEAAQKVFSEIPQLSKPISIAELLKYANMAYNEDERLYRIPNSSQISDILSSIPKTSGSNQLLRNLVDTTFTRARISVQMEDMGTEKLGIMNDSLVKKLNEIFPSDAYKVQVTGTSVLLVKNNEFLISSLYNSNISAIIIISLLLVSLFGTIQMIFIALIPNIIPLLLTSGIMGVFDISLKPSTVVVFSIAFGISVDYTIHFVAIYRHELKRHAFNISNAVKATLNETGSSMIYTAVILFFGFIIFALSTFGGTFWLGVLTTIALLISLFTNIFLLPAMLLSVEKRILKREVESKPLIDIEEDDEEETEKEN